MPRRKPKTPSRRALSLGEPFEDTDLENQWIERGNIISVNPPTCTCDVETETQGRFNGLAFPYLVQDPEGGGGRIYVPRPGQQVVVQQGLGIPFISQILPGSVDANANTSAESALNTSPVAGQSSFSQAGPANFAAKLPKDLLPGDYMWRGNQGQYLAVLDGGVVVMHGAPWSQIACTQQDDTTNVIGRNLNLISGFGNVRFFDEDGKCGLSVEGGTDQTLESGHGRENWTVQARVGEEAEGLVDFRINNRDGETVAKTIWKADGSIQQLSSGNLNQISDGNVALNIAGSRTTDVGGEDVVSVSLDRTELFYGSQTTQVSQNRSAIVLNDRTDQVNRDWTMNVGRSHTLKVSGDPLAVPGAVAADWMISNGSWIVDVGFPGSDLGAAQSSIAFNTYMPKGSITLSSLIDKIILDTTVPESVLLGSTLGVAPFHATLWEPLKLLLEQFITWAQNHVHPTGVGPSGPSTVPFPAESVLKPMLTPIQSTKVMLGA